MKPVAFSLSIAFVLILSYASGLHAENAPSSGDSDDYHPSIGQPGKDVVWVPTPDALVTEMLRMAKIGSNDYVMDLGSGDGRIAIAAAKDFGARATGIEYNPELVTLSNANARKAGVADKVKFIKADLFETDFSKADVITMYLLPKINLELRPKLLALRPGVRVVSHAFNMDDWKPDQTVHAAERHAYLWIVPAKVAGNWKVNAGKEQLELSLDQKYQMLSGRARSGKESFDILEGRVNGEEVRFVMSGAKGERREFQGRFKGKHLEGKVIQTASGKAIPWTAVRGMEHNAQRAALSTTTQ
ncbi:MAG TPA: class I SAM-dependent methyltransferase [Burkholderiales bacterium]|nr:class I SAM-dependent methyltransferase [Burkholderiales bacterium]